MYQHTMLFPTTAFDHLVTKLRKLAGFSYFGEELVVEDLVQCESVAGVFLQDA